MSKLSRRTFLGTSMAMAANLAASEALTAGTRTVAANEKVTVALVGCGGMGRANLNDLLRVPDFEIAALCDVDPAHIENAINDVKIANRPTEKIQTEKDFRRIVDRKDIDAVIVATPDHWHAY